jgi:hypothetical protein
MEVLELAKNNGVTVLIFPSHATKKLQPLDVGVFNLSKHFTMLLLLKTG